MKDKKKTKRNNGGSALDLTESQMASAVVVLLIAFICVFAGAFLLGRFYERQTVDTATLASNDVNRPGSNAVKAPTTQKPTSTLPAKPPTAPPKDTTKPAGRQLSPSPPPKDQVPSPGPRHVELPKPESNEYPAPPVKAPEEESPKPEPTAELQKPIKTDIKKPEVAINPPREANLARPVPENTPPPSPLEEVISPADPEPSLPEKAPSATAALETPEKGSFTIQIGAFGQRQNAEAAKRKVEESTDFEAYIESSGTGKLTFVYVGSYQNRQEAIEARSKLQKSPGFADAVIKERAS